MLTKCSITAEEEHFPQKRKGLDRLSQMRLLILICVLFRANFKYMGKGLGGALGLEPHAGAPKPLEERSYAHQQVSSWKPAAGICSNTGSA